MLTGLYNTYKFNDPNVIFDNIFETTLLTNNFINTIRYEEMFRNNLIFMSFVFIKFF